MKIQIECTPEEMKSLFSCENKNQTCRKSLKINASGSLKNIKESMADIHKSFDEFKDVDEIHIEVSDVFVC